MRFAPFASSFTVTSPAHSIAPEVPRADGRAGASRGPQSAPTHHAPVGDDALRWIALAVSSLVIAGLLSLAVVLGRLPILSRLIDDPLFFKRCLVVHVDLSLLVWFYAFLAGLVALACPRRGGWIGALSSSTAVVGVVAMLAGALVRGAQPVLANYIPVIDHSLFLAGLGLFFLSVVTFLAATLFGSTSASASRALPEASATGLKAAGLTVVLAAATWIASVAALPRGLDAWTFFEFSAWGAGHVLQVANVSMMLAIWLWVLERVTGRPMLSRRAAVVVFTALVLPHFAMPLLTARGALDSLYHSGATQLMRWGIFPVVLVVLALGVRHLWRGRAISPAPEHRLALLTGFYASAGLTTLGFVLGACIRSSTTLVPAHYHASLGGITVALMTAAYLIADQIAASRKTNISVRPECAREVGRTGMSVFRSARWQLTLFGSGQAVFALGFAIGGAYGLGRKAYAAEQHVRSAGEYTGLIVMGLGGLVAVAGGLWFLFLILREMRNWWRVPTQRAPASGFATPNS